MFDRVVYHPTGQAKPARAVPVSAAAFGPCESTVVRWLGGASVLINSRGTTLLIDPVLTDFGLRTLFEPPLKVEAVPRLSAVLVTHIDDDHFSPATCLRLAPVCEGFHAPAYVAGEMRHLGLKAEGHGVGEPFALGRVRVEATPADHCWQRESPEYAWREWEDGDCCGYRLDTPDGSVWLPGDSRLMDCQLAMPAPDVILLDFSDDSWHISLDGAVTLANAYPAADLICVHWGTLDAPDRPPFNADPTRLLDRVTRPARVRILAPGEPYTLRAPAAGPRSDTQRRNTDE